jgi:phosphonate degradation associated HDIG domain protein
MVAELEKILNIIGQGGAYSYGGEAVSQLEHALQCAALAEAVGEKSALITAALLHDLGHLLPFSEEAAGQGLDDRHEESGANYLQRFFGPEVTEPIRLHVPAKRYLCQVDKTYWDGLSPVSKKSLELQGGIFSVSEAEVFINQPFAKEAVRLRQWDDQAKVRGLATPNLDYFARVAEKCFKQPVSEPH